MANLRQAVRVFIDRNLSPAAQSARLAAIARKAAADLVAAGRASPRFTRYVDGRADADESTVKPDGLISYEFHYLGDAAEFALVFLQSRARPSVTGQYLAGFRVAVDGRPYTAEQFNKARIPSDAEVIVYNVEPYSRKIDVGYSGTTKLKYAIPPGLFDDAVKAVKRRFGNSVQVKRVYTVKYPGQYRVKSTGRLVDSPALVISRI